MRLIVPTVLASLVFAGQIHANAERPLPELVAQLKPSVCTILAYRDAGESPDSQGTAWFVAPGQVVTNRHVVSNARRATIRLGDGRIAKVEAVLTDDVLRDIVLLSVDLMPSPPALPLATTAVREGERVFAIGSPLGLAQTVSEGIVSSVRQAGNLGAVIQTTAAISPGSSGSPLFNAQGQVIGVATLQIVDGQALNFAIGVDAVRGPKLPTPMALGLWSAIGTAPDFSSVAGVEAARAKRVGSTPHPAVSKMSTTQYQEAIQKLHPAFRLAEADLTRAIEYGASQRKKAYAEVFGRYSKRAGRDSITAYVPLKLPIYAAWDDARAFKPLPSASEFSDLPDHRVHFLVQMGRYNNTKELNDPRFVLQLPDGTYLQPEATPKADEDKPKESTSSGIGSYYNYFTKRVQYYSYSDTYYSRSYTIWFDLLNPDGSPRVTPDAKEITLVLSLQGEEKRVKFKLSDWTADALPKPKAKK